MLKLLKSYKFWTAFAGAIGVLFMALSDTFGITINVDGVKEIIMSICGILIVFGFVKKPKNEKQKDINENLQEEKKSENIQQ